MPASESFCLGLVLILLLRLGGFQDIDEIPISLKDWFLVDPFYLDGLIDLGCRVRFGDPLVEAAWCVSLNPSRWSCDFEAPGAYLDFLWGVWVAVFENLKNNQEVSSGVVAALFVFSRRFAGPIMEQTMLASDLCSFECYC